MMRIYSAWDNGKNLRDSKSYTKCFMQQETFGGLDWGNLYVPNFALSSYPQNVCLHRIEDDIEHLYNEASCRGIPKYTLLHLKQLGQVMTHRTERIKGDYSDRTEIRNLLQYKAVVATELKAMDLEKHEIWNKDKVIDISYVLKAVAFARTLEPRQFWRNNMVKIVYHLKPTEVVDHLEPEELWVHPDIYYASKYRKAGEMWPTVQW